MKRWIFSLYLMLFFTNAWAEAQYRVVSTTGMIGNAVGAVAGSRAQVQTLMGPGIDPHLYKPTRSDISALSRARIVFYNGLLLEGKMTDALRRLSQSGRKVFAVTEQIPKHFLLEPQGFAGHFDPHVWMDPNAWSQAVEVVRKRLSEIDVSGAADYNKNTAALKEKLRLLDEYSKNVLSSVPEAKRLLVTAHDAFNYFGRRYGYEVIGIQGLSTESEAGVRDIEQIVSLLVSRKVPAVFVETTVADRNIRALIAGAAAQGHTVKLGGALYSDAMGKPGTYRGTYVGMIDHNVTTISRALGGNAPETGFQGKLSSTEAD